MAGCPLASSVSGAHGDGWVSSCIQCEWCAWRRLGVLLHPVSVVHMETAAVVSSFIQCKKVFYCCWLIICLDAPRAWILNEASCIVGARPESKVRLQLVIFSGEDLLPDLREDS
ncbi:hypothetical protein NDU88_011613 [Pleurodeles waltl]|uniref:Uncharacterized protein n=1 Tax=Pleurodeles waltl TaxID=8319 RepID=A0AAV7Q589_PLEWA|nr:hypothetical protein NDU88_011613 [Pleurodeles waltl]